MSLDRALGGVHRVGGGVCRNGRSELDLLRTYYPVAGSSSQVVQAFSNDARSDYHALLVEFVRRLVEGAVWSARLHVEPRHRYRFR